MYASPSHRCRGLDKNDGGALNLCVLRPRVATVANWQLQLGGGELQMCMRERERDRGAGEGAQTCRAH